LPNISTFLILVIDIINAVFFNLFTFTNPLGILKKLVASLPASSNSLRHPVQYNNNKWTVNLISDCTPVENVKSSKIVAWLNIDSYIFHDGDVQLVKDAEDDTLAAGGADRVVKGLNVNQHLHSVW